MKTFKQFYPQLISFQNLLSAYYTARKGKRLRSYAGRFELRLEEELLALQDALHRRTYRPGAYTSFYVYDPKKRLVSAAPFRDRVVHHALYNVLGPIYEPRFIYDSYACRPGKGTHRAVRRCWAFMQRHAYGLKADIRQYFPSIDHAVLQTMLRKKIADPAVLWLIDVILDSGRSIHTRDYVMQWFPGDDLLAACRPRGLPIGNLTSQFFANVYLHELDMFITTQLRWRHYLRYCDDFVLFGNDKGKLREVKAAIADFLGNLRLRLHPKKSLLFPVKTGLEFLGYRLLPTQIRLKKANVRRFVIRLQHSQQEYEHGRLSLHALQSSLQAWIAHATHANTYRLRTSLLKHFVVQKRLVAGIATDRR